MHENLNKLKNKHDELLREQKIITLDQFNAKKLAMETIILKKSENFAEKRDIIMSYKNKQNTYKQLVVKLKDLNTYTGYYNNGKESS